MPFLEFVAQSQRNEGFLAATGERLVNLHAEPLPEGALARFQLRRVPGSELVATLPSVFVRAMANAPAYDSETGIPSDRLVVAAGGSLIEVTADGDVLTLGAIADDERTTISSNNGIVTAVSGGKYYTYDTSVTEPTAGAFSNFGAVEFLGDYTILTERNGRRIQWSALADPSSLPGLNFATAESRDDVILRPLAITGNLWIFKTTSIEIWQRTGAAGADAFALIPGAVIETGLLGFNTVTKIPNGAFFVGDDLICYITGGGQQLQPVSTPAVNEAMQNGEPTDCLYYENEGHKFCVVRFRDRPAWVYNIATGLWHERASGDLQPWGATVAASVSRRWYLGGFSGAVHVVAPGENDAGATMFRRAVSRPLQVTRDRFRVALLELQGQVGQADLGRDAEIMVRLSRDRGLTWSPEKTRSMGALGQYDKRVVLRNLGQARVLVAEVALTDDADLRLLSRARVELA